jgi:hypothetical protein
MRQRSECNHHAISFLSKVCDVAGDMKQQSECKRIEVDSKGQAVYVAGEYAATERVQELGSKPSFGSGKCCRRICGNGASAREGQDIVASAKL